MLPVCDSMQVQASVSKIGDLQDFANTWQESGDNIEALTNSTDTLEVIKVSPGSWEVWK